MTILQIKNLHVSVEDILILKGIDLTIKKGEIHALIGPNGHGKSTLLLAIMGHPKYKIEQGEIIYKNENLLQLSVDQRSHNGIFLAMQNPLEISGVSNMDFLKGIINARRDSPISLYEFIKDLEAKSKEVGFDLDLASRHLNEGFSGGEKKRNELLQMKLLKPSLALIDEIDSGLDIDGLKMVTSSIEKMNDGEFCALIVSHYFKMYKEIKPTNVHIIIDGRIVLSGDYLLIEKVNKEGYGWIEKDLKISLKKEEQSRPSSIGLCVSKEFSDEKCNN